MDYKRKIAKAIKEFNTQKTSYSTFFKREAKNAHEVEYEEYDDFFISCNYIISLYKKEIKGQFDKALNEFSNINNEFEEEIKKGFFFDAYGNSIQELLKQNEEERESILNEGYQDNFQYVCCIRSDNGEIVENSFTGCLIPTSKINRKFKYDIFKLTYSDIEAIEKCLDECKNKLCKVKETDIILLLNTQLTQVRMKEIHQYLFENEYIDVDINSWLYWFSKQTWNNKKKNPSQIKWIDAAYHLTNTVYLICGNMEVYTETAMKKAFKLPTGRKFQKNTLNKEKNQMRDKEPYKSLYHLIEWSERNAIK